MKIPMCQVCGKHGNIRADLVEFANLKPLSDVIGHRDGHEWFCYEHIDAAKSLVHLSSDQAIKQLRIQFGYPEEMPDGPEPSCPECGHKNWDDILVPGQIELQQRISWIAGKIASVGYGIFLVGLLLSMLPWVQVYALIALGLLLAIIPAYFIVQGLEIKIETRIHLCKVCHHPMNSLQFVVRTQQEAVPYPPDAN